MRILRRKVVALGIGALLLVVPGLSGASSSAGQQWAGPNSPAVGNDTTIMDIVGHPFPADSPTEGQAPGAGPA